MYTFIALSDISVLSVINFSELKLLRTDWEVNLFFNSLKAFCTFLNHLNLVFFLINSVNSAVIFKILLNELSVKVYKV